MSAKASLNTDLFAVYSLIHASTRKELCQSPVALALPQLLAVETHAVSRDLVILPGPSQEGGGGFMSTARGDEPEVFQEYLYIAQAW